jgi:signal transduction histidine kinase
MRETEGFKQLRKFCEDAFQLLAEFRLHNEPITPRRQEFNPEDKPEIQKAIETIRGAISWNPALVERFGLIEKAIDVFFEQSEQTALYRDRLTAGLLASIVMHHVGVPLNQATPILLNASAQHCEKGIHQRAFQIIAGIVPRINEGYRLLAGGPKSGDYRVKQLDIIDILNVTVAQMKAVSETESMKINLEENLGKIEAKVRRADIWAIVTNLVANAIQASDYEQARDRVFSDEREIIVSSRRSNNDLVIEVEDNGPGLPNKPEGWIWEPYNTTKPNGSGLGLYIVSDIVTWYAGTKEAMASKRFKSGALFRITLAGVASVA